MRPSAVLASMTLALLLLPAPPVGAEMTAVTLLQELVRLNTSNPPGNESAVSRHLAELFESEGIATELTGVTADRQNLIVTIPGRHDTKPWLLLSHLDTVPADSDTWQHDPYAGTITGGMLWGRGALDDKGMVAAIAAALIELHRSGQQPEIPIVAVFAADEETGGSQGLQWLLQKRPELLDVRGVLNEGGFALVDDEGPARRTYYVSVGEKGAAWLEVRTEGTPGHGSVRWGDNANDKLIAALRGILEWHHNPLRESPMGQFAMSDLNRRGHGARSVTEALQRHPLGRQIERDPSLHSSLRNTCNLTVLDAGAKPNVIPGESRAMVDCRIVPGQTTRAFLRQAQRRAGREATVEMVFASEPNVSNWVTPFFQAIEKAAHTAEPGSMVVPVLAAGATDSRFWREKGVPAYGIVPIPITPELVQGMHGVDERVPVEGVLEAADFIANLLVDIAGWKGARPTQK